MEKKNNFSEKKVSQRLPGGLVILRKCPKQFRVTLPVLFVRLLEWADGDVLRITQTGKGIYIEKHKKTLLELRTLQVQKKELDALFS